MWPSIARDDEQLDLRCSTQTYHHPSASGLHPVARELLLISHPAEGRRLSWPEHVLLKHMAGGTDHLDWSVHDHKNDHFN